MRAHKTSSRLLALAAALLGLPAALQGQDAELVLGRGPAALQGQETSSDEGALFLLLPVGAQGISMGRAMTALSGQESVFWNPAGLARVSEGRGILYRGDHLAGEATALSVLLTSESLGTLGFSYQLLDSGDQELRDRDNQLIGAISVRNHLGVISFGTRLFERLDLGINFKIVRFRISCRGQCLGEDVDAQTYPIDVGVQSRPFEGLPLRLGAMVAHIGPKLQVINAAQADPLPTRLRVSAAYEVLRHFVPADPGLNLWLSIEVEDRWRDLGNPALYVGSQFSAGSSDMLFVRAGYVAMGDDQTDGPSIGFGFDYERFELSVARSLADTSVDEDEPVFLTFAVSF